MLAFAKDFMAVVALGAFGFAAVCWADVLARLV